MKTAANCVSIVCMLMAVAILGALAVGYCFGMISMQGSDVIIHFDGAFFSFEDSHYHDFYATTPIYFFVALLAVPLALPAIVAAVLFGRSSQS